MMSYRKTLIALAGIIAIAGMGITYMYAQDGGSQMTDVEMANVEALSEGEDSPVIRPCVSKPGSVCFIEAVSPDGTTTLIPMYDMAYLY